MAKEFLTSHKIPFQSYDVSTDREKQKEILEKTGQLGVPVILIDNEVIVGFDKPRISQILGIQ
jgi:glutaredoxin